MGTAAQTWEVTECNGGCKYIERQDVRLQCERRGNSIQIGVLLYTEELDLKQREGIDCRLRKDG